MLKIVILFIAFTFLQIANAKDFSLEEIRKLLLSQEVVILDKSLADSKLKCNTLDFNE